MLEWGGYLCFPILLDLSADEWSSFLFQRRLT